MNNGHRTVAGLLAVVAVLLGLNLIMSGSPRAVAQEPEIRIFPEPPVPEPTVVAGAIGQLSGGPFREVVYRFWSDGQIDATFPRFSINNDTFACEVAFHCGPLVVVAP